MLVTLKTELPEPPEGWTYTGEYRKPNIDEGFLYGNNNFNIAYTVPGFYAPILVKSWTPPKNLVGTLYWNSAAWFLTDGSVVPFKGGFRANGFCCIPMSIFKDFVPPRTWGVYEVSGGKCVLKESV